MTGSRAYANDNQGESVKADSENDFTLHEGGGEYSSVSANRTGTYREFVQKLFKDDELLPDLLTDDVGRTFSR